LFACLFKTSGQLHCNRPIKTWSICAMRKATAQFVIFFLQYMYFIGTKSWMSDRTIAHRAKTQALSRFFFLQYSIQHQSIFT
jgi:hypothetical protein